MSSVENSYSCLENLIDKPVLLQIGDPIAAAHSTEEVSLGVLEGEEVTCGRASMSLRVTPVLDPQGRPVIDPNTRAPVTQNQPVIIQILRGKIEAISPDGLMFSSLGGDEKTEVIIYVPMANVRAVTFCASHVAVSPEPEKPLILS